MKKKICSLISLVICFIMAASVVANAASTNLLGDLGDPAKETKFRTAVVANSKNSMPHPHTYDTIPELDDGSSGDNHWYGWYQEGTDNKISIKDAERADGKTGKVFSIENNTPSTSFIIVKGINGLVADKKYKLSGYIKATGTAEGGDPNAGGSFHITFNKNKMQKTKVINNINKKKSEWLRSEIVFTAPAEGLDNVKLAIVLEATGGSAMFYDLTLEEYTAPPSSAAPTSSAAPVTSEGDTSSEKAIDNSSKASSNTSSAAAPVDNKKNDSNLLTIIIVAAAVVVVAGGAVGTYFIIKRKKKSA